MPATLSVCMIIHNEESYLSRCLKSVQEIADEIIVVDTGSSDDSVDIARKFTELVYRHKWQDDFSEARNFSIEKASGDWILILDGDEELNHGCIPELLNKINQGNAEAYYIKVINYYENAADELLQNCDVVLRLFRNKKPYRYNGIIHEQILNSIMAANAEARAEIAEGISINHYGYLKKSVKIHDKIKRNMDLLQKAIANEPENLLNYFHLGLEYYRAKQYTEALELFNLVYSQVNLLSLYTPKLLCRITLCQYFLGRLDEALNFIDHDWLKAFPDMGDAYYVKAVICQEKGYFRTAYEILNQSLQLPSQPAYYANILFPNESKTYHHLGGLAEYFMDNEQALFYYLESLKRNPRMLASLRKIIAILNPKDYPEDTLRSLRSVFDLRDRTLNAALAFMFYEEGAYKLALDCIADWGDPEVLPENLRLLKGLCLLRSKCSAAGEKELKTICQGRTDFIKACQYRLLCCWLDRRHQEAAQYLVWLENSEAEPVLLEVLSLLTGKSTDKKSYPTSEYYQTIKEIMDFIVESGDYERVNEAWKKLETITGKRPSRLLAELYYQHQIYDRADDELQFLLIEGNDEAETLYYLGKTSWRRGKLLEGEKYLQETINSGLDTPRIRWELARIYQELAIQTLETGLKGWPLNEQLTETLKKLKDDLLPL